MAWAARLEGPWTLFGVGAAVGARGVFDVDGLSEAARAVGEGVRVGSEKPWGLHVASPDVHVDGEGRRFVVFVHMPVLGASRSQLTFGLESEDGLRFRPATGGLVGLGPSYFRVFMHEGRRYALTSGGWLHRAPAGGWGLEGPWQAGPRVLEVPKDAPRFPDGSFREGVVARHLAVEVREGRVRLYFSRIADAPEAILAADMPLQGDWRTWRAGPAREVHRARAAWEGADHPVRPSAGGIAAGGVNEVRDPYLFVDEDGRRVLVYCVQGERAIAARTLG